ncbi:MAG TPA: response regulator [Kofleriaceae bacterium]|nr:response regulator [Kofleriaceae bacterium]
MPVLVPVGGRLRILLAEDDPLNRHIAGVLLRRSGHHVIAVADGRAAVHAALRGDIDAVLMDLDMPVMSGLAAVRSIREDESGSGRHLPIIALTGHVGDEDEARALAAGCDGYVVKPFDLPTLLAEIVRSCAVARAAVAAAVRPVFDRNQFLARIGGDEALFGDLIGGFLDDLPARLAAIDRALKGHDGPALASVAHRLCGALLSLAAEPAADAARALERGAGGSPEDLEMCAGALEHELGRLAETLSATDARSSVRGRA